MALVRPAPSIHCSLPTNPSSRTTNANANVVRTYDTYDERLNSFRNVELWLLDRIDPMNMADAGFFYNKNSQQFQCYSCNTKLSSWKKGDRPMEVHKRLNPKCQFIRALQGDVDEDGDETCSEDEDDAVDGARVGNTSAQSHLYPDCANSRQPICHQSSLAVPKDKNELRKQNESLSMTCKKCHSQKIQTLFLPCRHLVTCEMCADAMDVCLICRATILGTVRTYFG